MQGPLTEFGLFAVVSVGTTIGISLFQTFDSPSISYSISIAFGSLSGGVLTPYWMTFKACSASMGVKPWPALLFLKRANLVYLSMFSISLWCSGNLIPYGSWVIGFDGSILLMLPSFYFRFTTAPNNGFLLFLRSRLTSMRGDHFWLVSRFRGLTGSKVRLAWFILVLRLWVAELSGFTWCFSACSGFLIRLVSVCDWSVRSS